MAVYDREFLIMAFLWRYTDTVLQWPADRLDAFVRMTETFYDSVGKETFRAYCSLDAKEIQKFRLATGY